MEGRRVPDSQIDFDADLVYYVSGERFTGVGYEDVPGYGRSEVSYLDGIQEGPARDWYPSGQLRYEANYVDGLLDGYVRKYLEDGSLVLEEMYIKGVKAER
jgi:hypothetical protein